jgi:hypothetical protein
MLWNPAVLLLIALSVARFSTSAIALDKKVAEEALKKNKVRLDELHRVSKTHRSFLRIFDQYEYVELDSTTIIADYGAKRQKELRFLHIPKTGTTLAATMVHYCCLMDGVYVNVLRQFNSIIPGHAVPKVCDMECFGLQPRSPNGDPWAHIPFRSGIDTSHTIAMFRQPESRLASQLAYMQIIGPKLMISFGFRRVDTHILYHLLTFNYDAKLSQFLQAAKANNEKYMFPTVIRDGAYELSTNSSQQRSANYATGKFLSLAEECVKLQEKLKIPPSEATKLYNLSYSANTIQTRLQQHFQVDTKGLESFQLCGMRAAVNYPGLVGCQTRMVLGRNCFDSYTLTARDVSEATRRVREEFLFVGTLCVTCVYAVTCNVWRERVWEV